MRLQLKSHTLILQAFKKLAGTIIPLNKLYGCLQLTMAHRTEPATQVTKDPASGRSHSGSRLRFRVLMLLVGVSLALGLAEVVLRTYVAGRGWTSNCYVGGVTLLAPDETNGYTLAPNYRFQSGVLHIETNEKGLRGPEINVPKPSDTRRIAMIGGSSVFGYLVSDGDECARLLEDRLRQTESNVEVINAGVPGYNLIQSTRRFESHVAPLQPDVVILYLGWNDLVYLLADSPDKTTAGVGPSFAAWERLAAHSVLYGLVAHRLMGRTAQFNPQSQSTSQPTEQGTVLFHEALQNIVKKIEASGAQVVICSQATLAHPDVEQSARAHLGSTHEDAERTIALGMWLRDYLKEFAESNEIPFIDVYNQIKPSEDMLGDVIHLTPRGEETLANLLESRLGTLEGVDDKE